MYIQIRKQTVYCIKRYAASLILCVTHGALVTLCYSRHGGDSRNKLILCIRHSSRAPNPLTPSRPPTLDRTSIHTSLSETVSKSLRYFHMTSFPISLRSFSDDWHYVVIMKRCTANVVREKHPCIYTLCHCTERIVGQAGKNSECAMDIIWDELKSNNVDIEKETLDRFILRHVRAWRNIWDGYQSNR